MTLSLERVLDLVLLGLLTVVAFLLGCYEMGDSDIWWHLRGGQWILEHGRVPGLDPFTFGSADRLWVDIHWSYEVILALTYRLGGLAAVILLAALLGAAAFGVSLAARRRDWPVPAVVLCWLPALVLFSFRLDPRPEIFSLFYLGCYLAVLWRVEKRPRLAWLLPLVQLLWVNVQGLFVLGPVVLGIFVAAHAADALARRLMGLPAVEDRQQRWWRHVVGASVAVAAACLVNPYFLDGALFPFLLFPKVAAENNPYKGYIDELMSARGYVVRDSLPMAGKNWFFLSFYFLLLVLPVSFLYPALWRAWQSEEQTQQKKRPSAAVAPSRLRPGLVGLAVVIGLLAASTLTLASHGLPDWVPALGRYLPLVLLLGGSAAAVDLRPRPWTTLLAFSLGAFAAVWMAWLQAVLFEPSVGVGMKLLLAVAAALCTGLVLCWGASLFRLLLIVAFCYLGLQALQNWSRFALVAGTVLVWNFAEWAGELRAGGQLSRSPWASLGVRLGLTALLGLWLGALASDRFYIHTGEPRHFALREEPLMFAHEAVQFAGRPGLPQRALVYGLGQTGLYVFHNAPRCKPYLDGRLEMPDTKTFQTYVSIEDALEQEDSRWEKALADLGDPLLLLEHEGRPASEAHLLAHPHWRCVYYDALASVFLPLREDTAAIPAVDFTARHFSRPQPPPVPNLPGAAAREEKALCNLVTCLPRKQQDSWGRNAPLLLCALDRGQQALEEDEHRPDVWTVLGNCCRLLDPHLHRPPPLATGPWRIERGIYWMQATWCYRRALQIKADHGPAWQFLHDVAAKQDMADVELEAGTQWLRHNPRIEARQRAPLEKRLASLQQAVEKVRIQNLPATQLPSVTGRLGTHFPRTAIRLIEEAEQAHSLEWGWSFAEQVALLYMHLGRPADARRIWEQAKNHPSEALRQCRLGSTFWVERNFPAALERFQQARKADPRLAEAVWALAMIHTQQGDAEQARQACREGLDLSLSDEQRSDLQLVQKLLGS